MGARILVADDSVTIQKVVELTFSREDFELITARTGEEAIRKAKESRPDLMLIDLVMPDKNGYEVCRTLREDPQLKSIPIVLLAGTFETFDKGEGIKVGANDFVTKPFESQTLIRKVKELLSGKAVPAAAEPARPRPPERVPAAPAAAFAPPPPAPLAAAAVSPPTIPLPSMAAGPPAPPQVVRPPVPAPPAPAKEEALEPVFELEDGTLLPSPPASPAASPSALPVTPTIDLFPAAAAPAAPAPPRAAAEAEPVDLQELSLDDLTAEEPLASVDLAAIDLEVPEPSVSRGEALAVAVPIAAQEAVPPRPDAELDLDFAAVSPATEPAPEQVLAAPEPVVHGTFAEIDMEALEAPAAPAPEPAPLLDLEPVDRGGEVAPAAPAGPPPLSTEELLRELEAAIPSADFLETGPAAAAPPALAVPEAAPAAATPPAAPPEVAPPAAPPAITVPPLAAPRIVELVPPRPPEPVVVPAFAAAPVLEPLAAFARPPEPAVVLSRMEAVPAGEPAAPSGEMAARLSAELAPYLARELVDKIVERIERVVWEVVPDLAEALIQREIDRLKESVERRSAR